MNAKKITVNVFVLGGMCWYAVLYGMEERTDDARAQGLARIYVQVPSANESQLREYQQTLDVIVEEEGRLDGCVYFSGCSSCALVGISAVVWRPWHLFVTPALALVFGFSYSARRSDRDRIEPHIRALDRALHQRRHELGIQEES